MNILVVGSAACVWEDLKAAPGEIDAVIAVNRMIRDYPTTPTFGATVHHEMAAGFIRSGVRMIAPRLDIGVDLAYDEIPYRHGTSVLYAVGFALMLGASVVIAGGPIDETVHYDNRPPLFDLAAYRAPWLQVADQIRGRVLSMSGWTRDLLGSP